jgi:hypothetical protein
MDCAARLESGADFLFAHKRARTWLLIIFNVEGVEHSGRKLQANAGSGHIRPRLGVGS